MPNKNEREGIGLPPRPFLYTPDQLAGLLSLSETYVKTKLLFYAGREPGLRPRTKMTANNIAPEGETPQWRVTENELIRYLRLRGIRFYDRGYTS